MPTILATFTRRTGDWDAFTYQYSNVKNKTWQEPIHLTFDRRVDGPLIRVLAIFTSPQFTNTHWFDMEVLTARHKASVNNFQIQRSIMNYDPECEIEWKDLLTLYSKFVEELNTEASHT